ncbi:hypothetical protein QJS10_CPB18g00653 [Acorus calamus]|uniref:Uncharacterized protein n=1 Tax=Acorus calamus TaxID=4465 RepID=A0AAV9CMH3_ACOCL|nr:hypothetical protein QJS10_CPB18g00653 [Acorus calamus]
MASPSLVDMAATDWDLVFKIKYGDALRRFGACVRGRMIDFTMGSLRSKIIVLFNFKPDADLTLTYIDEDGDVVTLMDDNDLHDAVILQRLNPLRITVQFNSNVTAGNSDARLPTPIQSYGPPKTHYSVDEFLNSMSEHVHLTGSCFEKALKHAPEPVHAAISKVSGELQSLVSKSALPAAEIVEHLLKSVISSGTPTSGSHDAPLKEATSAPPTSGNVHPSSSMPATVPNVSSPTELNNCEQDGINTVVGMGTSVSMNRVNDNVPGNRKAVVDDPDSTLFPARGIAQLRRDAVRSRMEKSHAQETSSTIPSIQQTGQNPPHVYLPQGPPIVMPPPGFGYSPSRAFSPVSFHTGVHCDGCGVHPIMGSRYKSKVKEDYDLCSTCFSTMGNEPDYFKIDRPIRSLGFNPHYKAHMSASRAFRYGVKSIKPYKLKLESRFIQDISVLDGTLMAPGTRFTKIWRMLNNGNVEWPSGTQLVWIGGDQFGDTGSVLLEISSNGFPIGGEIDVAVDFTAPSRPGRYTSYWRMAAPSGQKFGQRVWVLIQVDNRSDIMVNGFHGVPKLNLPPENSGQKGKEIVDVMLNPWNTVPPLCQTYPT